MDDLKSAIARNLVKLRQQAGYTQLQLAKMLNYSDKAVSKWERAEAIPDLHVLIRIARIYGVTLDELVSSSSVDVIKPKINVLKRHILISLMCVGLCFFVAAILFTIMYFIPSCAEYASCVFTIAFFASAVVLTVLSALWGNRLTTGIAVSLIVWSIAVIVHVFMVMFSHNEYMLHRIYMFYIVAGVFQLLIIFWFAFRRFSLRKAKKEDGKDTEQQNTQS